MTTKLIKIPISTKAIIKELTGVTAVGHRSPYWRQSQYLPELLVKPHP